MRVDFPPFPRSLVPSLPRSQYPLKHGLLIVRTPKTDTVSLRFGSTSAYLKSDLHRRRLPDSADGDRLWDYHIVHTVLKRVLSSRRQRAPSHQTAERAQAHGLFFRCRGSSSPAGRFPVEGDGYTPTPDAIFPTLLLQKAWESANLRICEFANHSPFRPFAHSPIRLLRQGVRRDVLPIRGQRCHRGLHPVRKQRRKPLLVTYALSLRWQYGHSLSLK